MFSFSRCDRIYTKFTALEKNVSVIVAKFVTAEADIYRLCGIVKYCIEVCDNKYFQIEYGVFSYKKDVCNHLFKTQESNTPDSFKITWEIEGKNLMVLVQTDILPLQGYPILNYSIENLDLRSTIEM